MNKNNAGCGVSNPKINRTKIKRGCQSYTKAAPQQSWSDLTLRYHISNFECPCRINKILLWFVFS